VLFPEEVTSNSFQDKKCLKKLSSLIIFRTEDKITNSIQGFQMRCRLKAGRSDAGQNGKSISILCLTVSTLCKDNNSIQNEISNLMRQLLLLPSTFVMILLLSRRFQTEKYLKFKIIQSLKHTS